MRDRAKHNEAKIGGILRPNLATDRFGGRDLPEIRQVFAEEVQAAAIFEVGMKQRGVESRIGGGKITVDMRTRTKSLGRLHAWLLPTPGIGFLIR